VQPAPGSEEDHNTAVTTTARLLLPFFQSAMEASIAKTMTMATLMISTSAHPLFQ
jgi:hypothetical protein